MAEKAYLGDGVYASFDGYYIWLSTQREYGEHRIALEPHTLSALDRFARQLRQPPAAVPDEAGGS